MQRAPGRTIGRPTKSHRLASSLYDLEGASASCGDSFRRQRAKLVTPSPDTTKSYGRCLRPGLTHGSVFSEFLKFRAPPEYWIHPPRGRVPGWAGGQWHTHGVLLWAQWACFTPMGRHAFDDLLMSICLLFTSKILNNSSSHVYARLSAHLATRRCGRSSASI